MNKEQLQKKLRCRHKWQLVSEVEGVKKFACVKECGAVTESRES